MGVSIKGILPITEIRMSDLSGKTLAVDAYNIIYQFLSSIRQPEGTPLMDKEGNITSHLTGLFYRNINLLEEGIKLVYVFDGKPPDFKIYAIEERAERKKEAEKLYELALRRGAIKEARKYSQQLSRLDEHMIEESKKLLSYMGIPIVQAPSEGEAQAAWMTTHKLAYGVVSQDFDSLLFGAKRLIRNLSVTGKRKLPGRDIYVKVPIELIELRDALENLNIDRERLIWIGILVGTDYTSGIKGIGPKTALKLVKKHRNLDSLLGYIKERYNYVFHEDIQSIVSFFENPPVKEDVYISFKKPDERRIKELLCNAHGFSEERVKNGLERLKHLVNEKLAQRNIAEFI